MTRQYQVRCLPRWNVTAALLRSRNFFAVHVPASRRTSCLTSPHLMQTRPTARQTGHAPHSYQHSSLNSHTRTRHWDQQLKFPQLRYTTRNRFRSEGRHTTCPHPEALTRHGQSVENYLPPPRLSRSKKCSLWAHGPQAPCILKMGRGAESVPISKGLSCTRLPETK